MIPSTIIRNRICSIPSRTIPRNPIRNTARNSTIIRIVIPSSISCTPPNSVTLKLIRTTRSSINHPIRPTNINIRTADRSCRSGYSCNTKLRQLNNSTSTSIISICITSSSINRINSNQSPLTIKSPLKSLTSRIQITSIITIIRIMVIGILIIII